MMKIRLRYERSGKVRDVVEFRRDGWPICPGCYDDELAALRGSLSGPRQPAQIDRCYRCGPVEVVSASEPEAAELPGLAS